MADAEVLTEVPESLKRLVRYIVRGFYSIEHSLIIDMLVHHPCIKEDDLVDLLKMDRKQLRQIINTLKNDKFIKARMRVETDSEGRTTRHNYYFINYSTFVNVVKYKLDHIRRKIETEERDSTSRASFRCPECGKVFTDLEADQLFDPFSGIFLCTFCKAEVKEEMSATPKKDARSLMVKFNEQIEPVFVLLREVEDVKLSEEINNPEPTDLSAITKRESGGNKVGPQTERWGDKKKSSGINYEGTVTINMAGDTDTKKVAPPTKERPIWMTESTIEGAMPDPMDASGKAQGGGSEQSGTQLMENDDIMRTLLAHEKKASAPNIPIPTSNTTPGGAASDDDTSTSESEDEISAMMKPCTSLIQPAHSGHIEVMQSDEDDEDAVAMVMVAGKQVPYHDVTQAMVTMMSQEEKDAYIQKGQEMYQDMYD